MFPARVLRTRPTKALCSVPQSVEIEYAENRKRKKKEKRSSGNFACKKCSKFYADSSKKLQAHERRCNYLQELSAFVTQRDILLVEMNERNEYCCKACKFNFKFRKDNLFAHVQNNFCAKGAKMPPKPVDPDNPKQSKERQTTRKSTKIKRSKANPSATNLKSEISTTSMAEILHPSNRSIDPTEVLEFNITVPYEAPVNISYSENYVDTNVTQAIDTGAFTSFTYIDSLDRNIDNTFAHTAAFSSIAVAMPAAHTIPQSSIMSYTPTYYPSYSQYAEFSPRSVPFQEIIGTLNSAQPFTSLSNRK